MTYVVRVNMIDKNTHQQMSSYFLTFAQAYELIFAYCRDLKDKVEFNIGMIRVENTSREYLMASKNYEEAKKSKEDED